MILIEPEREEDRCCSSLQLCRILYIIQNLLYQILSPQRDAIHSVVVRCGSCQNNLRISGDLLLSSSPRKQKPQYFGNPADEVMLGHSPRLLIYSQGRNTQIAPYGVHVVQHVYKMRRINGQWLYDNIIYYSYCIMHHFLSYLLEVIQLILTNRGRKER